MKKENQQIKIAEACGKLAPGFTPESLGGFRSLLPNYLGDLNAMHEADKLLSDEQHFDYRCELWVIISGNRVPRGLREDNRRYLSATAAQRAEAFLKTLNLWEQ